MDAPAPWAIVVPGHSAAGRISPRCRQMLARAAELAELRTPRAVVFSGWAPLGGATEAEQMLAAWAGRRDVELVLEPTARTTAENASRSLPLLLRRGVGAATVVCAPLHALRVRYFFGSLYPRFGIACDVRVARAAPAPRALAWELAALGVARRQLRAALADVEEDLAG